MDNNIMTNNVYHVLNKSIAGYKIFNNDNEFSKFVEAFVYYQSKNSLSFSDFVKRKDYKVELIEIMRDAKEKQVDIISYCLMPTHFHFILKELKDNGISKFLNNTLNSYTRYFNTKYNRKGPLWQGRTKKIIQEA